MNYFQKNVLSKIFIFGLSFSVGSVHVAQGMEQGGTDTTSNKTTYMSEFKILNTKLTKLFVNFFTRYATEVERTREDLEEFTNNNESLGNSVFFVTIPTLRKNHETNLKNIRDRFARDIKNLKKGGETLEKKQAFFTSVAQQLIECCDLVDLYLPGNTIKYKDALNYLFNSKDVLEALDIDKAMFHELSFEGNIDFVRSFLFHYKGIEQFLKDKGTQACQLLLCVGSAKTIEDFIKFGIKNSYKVDKEICNLALIEIAKIAKIEEHKNRNRNLSEYGKKGISSKCANHVEKQKDVQYKNIFDGRA